MTEPAEDTAEIGVCAACGQELIRTESDCWHPHTVARACPPENKLVVGVQWGDGFGRPGRDKWRPRPWTEELRRQEELDRAAGVHSAVDRWRADNSLAVVERGPDDALPYKMLPPFTNEELDALLLCVGKEIRTVESVQEAGVSANPKALNSNWSLLNSLRTAISEARMNP